MTSVSIEKRVKALESEVQMLKERLPETEPPTPWWQQISGIFKDDPMFDEAMRLGREWRESEREEFDEEQNNSVNKHVSA